MTDRVSITPDLVIVTGSTDGTGESPRLACSMRALGYAVHIVNPNWAEGFDGAAAGAAAQVDKLGLSEAATLLGHSRGALVAARLAAGRAWERFIVCSITPTGRHLTSDPDTAHRMWVA